MDEDLMYYPVTLYRPSEQEIAIKKAEQYLASGNECIGRSKKALEDSSKMMEESKRTLNKLEGLLKRK